MDFKKVKTLEKYREEGLQLEHDERSTLELGNDFEWDLEQLDVIEKEVEKKNIPENVKEKILLKVQRAKLELMKAYDEKVTKTMEEKEKAINVLQKEMDGVIKDFREMSKEIKGTVIETGETDPNTIEKEIEKPKTEFEKELEIIKARQKTTAELMQKQQVDILRHKINNSKM